MYNSLGVLTGRNPNRRRHDEASGLLIGRLAGIALALAPTAALAQVTTPNVISTPGDVTTTLGPSLIINHGLVRVGRISASLPDSFGETFGSVSGLQVTGWTNLGNGSYGGTFNILPDRGYNSGNFFADYAARIQQVSFLFTPYGGAANIGRSSVAEKIAVQSQIVFTSTISGVKFTYLDPTSGRLSVTTGLIRPVERRRYSGRLCPTSRPTPGSRRRAR
jgi:hypothetical protein